MAQFETQVEMIASGLRTLSRRVSSRHRRFRGDACLVEGIAGSADLFLNFTKLRLHTCF